MRRKEELILAVAGLLLGISIWLLATDYSLADPGTECYNRPFLVIRQGVTGVLALTLAYCLGRSSFHRILLWFLCLPVALFAAMLLAVPFSVLMGFDPLVNGLHWWQGNAAIAVSLLALISSIGIIYPRFRKDRGSGYIGIAILFPLLLAMLVMFHDRPSRLFLFASVFFVALATVVRSKWSLVKVGACALIVAVVTVSVLSWKAPRHLPWLSLSSCYQADRSQLLIHAGGWFGSGKYSQYVPNWYSDFIFARLCGAGGLVLAIALLLVTGWLFTLSWGIVLRQKSVTSLTVGAACAAALTVQPLLVLAVNTGLFSGVISGHFPFLGYGPMLVVCDGVLVGILLSMHEDENNIDTSPACCSGHLAKVIPITHIFLFLIGLRVFYLVSFSDRLADDWKVKINDAEHSILKANRPPRGRILDVHGRVLAQPVENVTVCANPTRLQNSQDRYLLPALARILKLDEQDVEKRLFHGPRYYARFSRNVPEADAVAIRRLNIDGVYFEKVEARRYPYETSLAHLVGCTRIDGEGVMGAVGIEQVQNTRLTSGEDVQLKLDIDLQIAMQKLVETAAVETQAKQAQIIVINPKTGAIRAAAQFPSIHGEDSHVFDMRPRTWLASCSMFDPGALIRPLILASALEKRVVDRDSRIDCRNGQWMYEGVLLKDPVPYAELNPEEILLHSSNIGMVTVGLMMGENMLHEVLMDYSLQEKCLPGFGGATKGFLGSPEVWSKVDVARIPNGNACAFSPLQLLRAYSAIFNEGSMVAPYLVATPDSQGEAREVFSPETADWMRQVLTKVVEDGDEQAARIEGLSIAGLAALTEEWSDERTRMNPPGLQAAFIGAFETAGAPYLIAVFLNDPVIEAQGNPALAIFKSAAQVIIDHE